MNFLKKILAIMKKVGFFVSKVVNTILLVVVYFIGVGPTSLIARIFKKKFLDLEICKAADSYWTELDLNSKKKEDYLRQF